MKAAKARAAGDEAETLDSRRAAQARSLGLTLRAPISGVPKADRFLARVGIALRYGPARDLPLASLYRALAGADPGKAALAEAIALTNRLLGEARAIEVHVIADRVALVHRSVMPALYALVRRGRGPDDLDGLGPNARTALAMLRDAREVTAGEVRKRLGLPSDDRHDPAYLALGELERVLLVDRGPFAVPKSGIPYLSSEGYPYHLFHEAHPDLVKAAARYSPGSAAQDFLQAYLEGAVFARLRKLASLFKAFLSAGEITAAVQGLARKRKVHVATLGREAIVTTLKEERGA